MLARENGRRTTSEQYRRAVGTCTLPRTNFSYGRVSEGVAVGNALSRVYAGMDN